MKIFNSNSLMDTSQYLLVATADNLYPALNYSKCILLVIHYNPRIHLVKTIDSLAVLLKSSWCMFTEQKGKSHLLHFAA